MSCTNTLKNGERPILGAFFNLGSSDTISEDVYMKLERFVCQLYSHGHSYIRNLGEVGWLLFSKKQYVPPTEAALQQLTRRANFVALVCKSCDNPNPNLPGPTLYDWQQDGDRLQPGPTTLPPAYKARPYCS